MGHSRALFLNLLNTVNVLCNRWMMAGFEPRTSGVGSDCSTNWAITTAHNLCFNVPPLFAFAFVSLSLLFFSLKLDLHKIFFLENFLQRNRKVLTRKIPSFKFNHFSRRFVLARSHSFGCWSFAIISRHFGPPWLISGLEPSFLATFHHFGPLSIILGHFPSFWPSFWPYSTTWSLNEIIILLLLLSSLCLGSLITAVNYNSRVIPDVKIPHITTLEL